ncbi:MAG: family 1 encapsulin nanocompartment shell protein, partial [Acidimicrobiia bacterium]
MSHLLRSHAPISSEAWRVIDEETHDRLIPSLAARRLVDFSGPLGWGYSSTTFGRVTEVEPPVEGLRSAQRVVVPVVELRADFTIARSQLRDLERDARGIDLGSLDEAAERIAR